MGAEFTTWRWVGGNEYNYRQISSGNATYSHVNFFTLKEQTLRRM